MLGPSAEMVKEWLPSIRAVLEEEEEEKNVHLHWNDFSLPIYLSTISEKLV